MPELSKVLADVKPTANGTRITMNVDAKQAAALIDSVSRPARQAAIRSQCVNNEKQIGLAIHNYISVHESFPPAYTTDKAGKPLLSWRVLILPYIEQDALYKEFHLDEAWDSPHNKALIARMPAPYRCPSENDDLSGQGKNALRDATRQIDDLPGDGDGQAARRYGRHIEHNHGRRGWRRQCRCVDQAG